MKKQDGFKVKRKLLLVPIDTIATDHKFTESAVKQLMTAYRLVSHGRDSPPPVVVRRVGRAWKLVDGRHRLEAQRRLGWKTVPVYEER